MLQQKQEKNTNSSRSEQKCRIYLGAFQCNEKVVKIAIDATKNNNINMLPEIPHTDHKSKNKEHINQQWQTIWDTQDTKLQEIKPIPHSLLYRDIPPGRRDQSVISKLWLGDTKIAPQHIFRKEEPPTCDQYPKPVTVKYLLSAKNTK
ncbi:unnamed protein product [Psylliodes chrysocephalus]|uniref:Uncharacterized protein n=1 Tax=Psylliodes chrysocephalus TaxID=3402493 RepID=A0A9P0GD69_9CUCU|nr:unnamed protein product [Psylliodes chrysocephala]